MAIEVTEQIAGLKFQNVAIEEVKTAGKLLDELGLTSDHIVLVNGKTVEKDFLIEVSDSVIILPLIKGG